MGAPLTGRASCSGNLNFAIKNLLCKKDYFPRAVGDVGPYRLVENFYQTNRNLLCKNDDFIKVGLKDEEKIL